jgi:hypothetical protein
MNDSLQRIRRTAMEMGACRLAGQMDSPRDAVRLLFTAQGREFCMKHQWPSRAEFASMARELENEPGIFIESGRAMTGTIDVLASGASDVTVLASGADRLRHVVACNGARVRLDVRNHAVVTACAFSGAHIDITNDGTGSVTLEMSDRNG